MKKVNAKQLLAIAVCGLTLASCGGGGGGGGSSQTQTQISANPIAMNIYEEPNKINKPFITVWINGQPVNLEFDTAASGVLINQGAVPIPQSAYTSQTFYGQFGDGKVFSGTVANVQVCLTSASTDCINMPVAVNSNTSGSTAPFPTGRYVIGDFGMDCSENTFATNNTFCPLYYLWQQNQYFNAYSFTFYQPSNGYYDTPSINTPIGSITLGNFSPSNLISYSKDPSLPVNVAFTNAYYTNSYTGPIIFDTGTQDIALSGSVLQAEIPNFNPSLDENNCWTTNWLQGGYQISYSIPYANNSSMFTTSFITEPPANMCSTLATLFTNQHSLLIEGFTMDASSVLHRSAFIGLAGMFNHNFTWLLGSNGMVQYISIQ